MDGMIALAALLVVVGTMLFMFNIFFLFAELILTRLAKKSGKTISKNKIIKRLLLMGIGAL